MIKQTLAKFGKLFKFKQVGIGILIALLQLFLYFNADILFSSNYSELAQKTILTYMMLQVMVIAYSGLRPATAKNDKRENIWNFLFMFFVTSLILITIPIISDSVFSVSDNSYALAIGLIQAVVVAYPEEVVFRGLLPRVFGNNIIPAILFAGFHFAVSGMNFWFMLFAFISSFVFSMIAKKFGILGAVGTHTAYNLQQYGVLSALFSGRI